MPCHQRTHAYIRCCMLCHQQTHAYTRCCMPCHRRRHRRTRCCMPCHQRTHAYIRCCMLCHQQNTCLHSLLYALPPAKTPKDSLLYALLPAKTPKNSLLYALSPAKTPTSTLLYALQPAKLRKNQRRFSTSKLNFKYTKNRSSTRMITLQSLLNEFKSVFASSKNDIGRINGTDHYIRLLDNSRPIYRRHYRHSIAELNEIRKQVSALLDKGLIRKSKSPWAFPVTLANKSDGTLRLCIDYRPLNAITIDEREPIPIVQDIIDKLAKAKVFSVLDMAWGYWHVPIHPESIDKTAFITPDGHYEWLVLPFGLKNAPATFQRIVREVLGETPRPWSHPIFR